MNDGPKKITRIDLTLLPNNQGTMVEKYLDGWTASTRAAKTVTNKEMTFSEIVEWLKTNGWTVYEWPACYELDIEQGARAFLGNPMPVRSSSTLIWYRGILRERVQQVLSKPADPYTGARPSLPIDVSSIDLAFYL